ncbi:rhomboid family intramembrane serine protease [Desulfuromonas thiophila]|uniref:Membrane associated serine protease, rhomboid family n=1 Tax=Desulfuromonas thiophila TaxID=57664 RepID=A0A1G6Z6I5_9BACT|nr:rhomboid family intramembrane serine protease [Desulfuromonas thiophila]SDD98220.1 Membrane associated serine protease, rhomboid family [Desulfuromonas thiophila]
MDIKRLFDSIGLNGTRWQWRILRWQRQWQQARQGQASLPEALSVSRLLLLANLLLFSVMVLRGAALGQGMNALLRPTTELLVLSGGQWWPLVLDQGQWWRCLTYAFTHGGLLHLGFNMMVLYQVGPQLEREIGSAGFILLYLLTAVTATAAGLLWHPLVVVVGASGALFGLIGFSISYFHRCGGPMAHAQRDFMLRWAIFAFIFGLLVGADNAAHLGGACSGALLGFGYPIRLQRRRQLAGPLNLLAGLAGLALLASLVLLVASWF